MTNLFRVMLISLSLIILKACMRNNQLKVNVDDTINTRDIEIHMEVLASIPKTIIYDGVHGFNIPNGYGENEWYFSYKDSLNGYLRHMKSNRNDKHSYEFTFFADNGKYFVTIFISGPDNLKQTIELKNDK